MRISDWSSDVCSSDLSGREADDRNALLTVILADGINLGLTRMAETCRGASLRQLAHLHDWHISEAAYGEALARLIDAHRTLPLAALWGDGTTSSSDGQQFHAVGRGAAIGDINARSGNEPGVRSDEHTSELQSLMRISYAVFCLQTQTKKTITTNTT